MLKNILVPTDGSEESQPGIDHAVALARHTHATIHLLNVLNTQTHSPAPQFRIIEAELRQAGVPVETAICSGQPAEHIIREAAAIPADLIAMAPGRRRGTLGSVAEAVVREAACPVLLVQGSGVGREYRRILVPLDDTPLSMAVLPLVTDLARIYRAEVVLLYVVDVPMFTVPLVGETTGMNVAGQYAEEGIAAAQSFLNPIAAELRQAGIQVETACRSGEPKQEIAESIRRMQPDLVIMSTHSRSRIEEVLFGSVAHYILQHSMVPLILYHPRKLG